MLSPSVPQLPYVNRDQHYIEPVLESYFWGQHSQMGTSEPSLAFRGCLDRALFLWGSLVVVRLPTEFSSDHQHKKVNGQWHF